VLVQECHGDSVFVNANKFSNPWIGVRGIYNYYTHVEVAQDTFIGDSSHSGVGIWMDDINFFGLSNAGDYSITDNLVDLYGFGIGSNGCNNLVIDQNEVHIRGIHSTYGTGAGIAANGSDSALVRENEVRGYAALAEEIDGILVSSSPEVQVKCNEIFNFRNDLRFRFPSLAANVRENVFHAGLRGWVYQDSANLSTQGGPGDPAGNTWNSGTPGQSWNCPGTGTFMSLVINTTLNNEFMYVRNTQFQNPEHSNNPQCFGGLQGVGYHLTTSGGGPATCGPVGNSGGDPGSNRVAVLNGIADENAAAKGDAAPLRYQKEQYALAVLDGDTGLCQSDPKLQDCHQRLNTGNRKDILTTQRKLAAGQATAALAHNGFAPKNQIESNHRFVTRAIAKWAIERLIEATDSTELREIAGQCPPVGGRAVYQARTLLGLLDPALILLNHGCSSAAGANKQADAGEEASSLPLVEFYPNPAGSVLRVKSGDAVKVGMYNLHGVALRNWELDPGTNRLDLPRVPAGVYLFRYQLESGQRGTVRIVLR
ncbi:MAG: T9SS type A sorting domain-containing protein, partial [Bacteroidota bacterium]